MTINLNIKDVHVHLPDERCEFLGVLGGIASGLEALAGQSKGETKKRMALSTAEQALVARFNTATSAIAERIRKLIEDAATMDDAEFNAALTGIADGLDALGQPATPIPGPGPQPTP